ncbi:hypothetical protein [Leifsonia sp. 2MCAF36]|uniref:hypothetical protein n=1 Tax=Leifsonia sp. 2MCAF36 TaxID=3232988 RepID=UPI003F9D66DA
MSAASEAITGTRQAARSVDAEGGSKAKKAATFRPSGAADDIRTGLEPRVDLLPAEIRTSRKHEQIVRRMVFGLVAVVAVTLLAVLGANALALTAGAALVAEQAHGTQLIQQQQKYVSLRTTQSELALVKAAQAVGGATHIDWGTRGAELIGTLPTGSTILNVSINAATPVAPYQQSTVPGVVPQVASATVTIAAPDLASVTRWLSTIGGMRDVTDTAAGAVTIQSGGTYQATATIYYGVGAWDNRYLTPAKGK